MELTYGSYLKINELLELQQLQSKPEEHDEMLFIIIHQAYELWFKQIMHELDRFGDLLMESNLAAAQKTLKRVTTILKVIVHQVDILETMTPLEFLSFRDYLESASGFQSWQFRELEFALGKKDEGVLARFADDPVARQKLQARLENPTIWDFFLKYLSINSYEIPGEILARDVTKPCEPNPKVQEILVDIYQNSPMIAQLCELLVDFDEGLQEWRYRHVKMVERTIGAKTGTGGSPGVEYLKRSLFAPVFPDLWDIRTELKYEN
jgi:tryptophan 2,3-dioxygenase